MKKSKVIIGIVVFILTLTLINSYVQKSENAIAYNDHTPRMIKTSPSDIMKRIREKKQGIYYFGFPECPWCIELLPTQFVLKCNHNSGCGMYICKDKSKMNVKKVKRALRKGLNQDYYLTCREWPYKNVKRKIVCEQFMGDSLIDYKIQCINGHVDHFMVCYGRTETKLPDFYYFDKDWNFLPYNPYLTELVDFETIKPKHIDEMIRIAEILGKESPAMRVDLYEINDHVYFGEMTLFNHGGFDAELPYEIDLMLGKKLQLPEKKK
ncbi:hypothetical protein IV49_GL001818 [Kandleria vitulina DSM 20405]|uniref:Uncharacterized protein n=1 Tax=Kandleria vitulina DSM 20405 TaxID=1410657 RepID=A0A0R2HN27_9FIRM|nr:ATP-grasp fold amidoligase family protein [Kandleria vitulina]KRN50733.1 hypothetical protein IV49_GL001818 [Kandleria vitulina DSM 20405]